MEKRKLGKTNLEVSVLGFGGAEIGYQHATGLEVEKLLGSALDSGLNVIDTAECYLDSEEKIGKAVGHRRKEYFLFSKCGHSRGYNNPDWQNVKRLEKSLDESLRKLKTDYLDLYQIHSCSKAVLAEGEVPQFMQKAKSSGKVRFIGYSGENEAAAFAASSGIFDTLQISVNLADQHAIDQILPEAVKQKMGIIAKRPLANVAWRYTEKPEDYHVPYWQRFKRLQYAFLKSGSSEAVATALRFTLSVPGVSVAIVGTRTPGRWQENASLAALGPLETSTYESIRHEWRRIASIDWEGQI